MGQHKTNPVAQAAKRGELEPRRRDPKTGDGLTRRSVLDIVKHGKKQYGEVVCAFKREGRTLANGTRIERRFPKVRGKAAVKAAKKARRQWREHGIAKVEAA